MENEIGYNILQKRFKRIIPHTYIFLNFVIALNFQFSSPFKNIQRIGTFLINDDHGNGFHIHAISAF